MKKYSYFKIDTRTKLKFNPGQGTDVALPTANPVTQYLPTRTIRSNSSIDETMLTGRTYPQADSTSPVKQFPSSSSIMRATPVTSTVKTTSTPPVSSPTSSVSASDIGITKKEGYNSSVNITGARAIDNRKAINPRTLGQSAQKNATGLLGSTRNRNDYYRRVLNAL